MAEVPWLPDEATRQLATRLRIAVLGHLVPRERQDVEQLRPPMIIPEVIDGELYLTVDWAGSQTSSGWDGSLVDAASILDGLAEAIAINLSGDYWSAGGWRDKRTFE